MPRTPHFPWHLCPLVHHQVQAAEGGIYVPAAAGGGNASGDALFV